MAIEPLHTLGETAKILGISERTLTEHVKHGNIRCEPIGFGKVRKHLRFTDQNIATFLKKIKIREVAPCQSSNTATAPIIKSNFKSTVILFESLRKPPTKKKQKH